MIRSGEDHRIDVRRFEKLAVIVVEAPFATVLRLAFGVLHVALLEVAKRVDLAIPVFQKGVEHLVAPVAQPDKAHADAVIRTKPARVPEGSESDARSAHESSPIHRRVSYQRAYGSLATRPLPTGLRCRDSGNRKTEKVRKGQR